MTNRRFVVVELSEAELRDNLERVEADGIETFRPVTMVSIRQAMRDAIEADPPEIVWFCRDGSTHSVSEPMDRLGATHCDHGFKWTEHERVVIVRIP